MTAVGTALHLQDLRREFHFRVYEREVGVEIAPVQGVVGAIDQLHVLLRHRPPSIAPLGCEGQARPGGVSIAQHGYRPAMSDVHVVLQGDGWALEVAGDKRESFDTQDEAIRRGRELAEQEQGELVIHGQDGRIREKDSHGHDPPDIPG